MEKSQTNATSVSIHPPGQPFEDTFENTQVMTLDEPDKIHQHFELCLLFFFQSHSIKNMVVIQIESPMMAKKILFASNLV